MSTLTQTSSAQDRVWMQRAIELAKQGQYSTKPNPNVGCVIVKDGQLVGEGFILKQGNRMRKFLLYVQQVNLQKVQQLM